MTYNMTELGQQTDIVGLVTFANNNVNFMLVGLFIISIFIVITFMFTKRMNLVDSLVVSSFICFVLSVIGVYINLLNFIYPLLFLVVVAFGSMYLYYTNK